jgi:hypothetical protein
MSWFFRVLTALTVIAALLIAPITVGAAPDPTGTASTSTATTTEPGEQMSRTISPVTYVETWEYDHGRGVWTITVQSEVPTQLTVSESVVMDSEGSERFNIRQYDIERGQTTLTFRAPPESGLSRVSLTTTESIAAGTGVALQSGSRSTGNPFTIFDGIDGLAVGVFLSVGMAALSAVLLLRREADGVEVAD